VRAAKRFTETCIARLRAEIGGAGGNEVFALGWLDGKGRVDRLEVRARGNEGAVPALRRGESGGETEAPDVLIHNHPSGFLVPSDNDLVIAGRAAEDGTGAFIVDNAVEEVYVVAEPVRRRRKTALDAEALAAMLRPGGAVAERLSSHETRQSQLDLLALIVRGFNGDALVAAEAGTGVGKSFAYLLPAVHYALANNERIVISTATITLQQQLFEKDIPLLVSALPPEAGKKIKAVLVKGRGNYLCRRRLDEALKEPFLYDGENEELERICAWAETSGTGSRSDLSFVPAEGLWSRICSEGDTCMGMRCPERERCFVFALRREAADAKILVANHHLLFADLAARHEGAGYDGTVVLPPYARVIIDEAHTIEGAATSFFSRDWSCPGLYRQLGRLYRVRQTRKQGLLVRLAPVLRFEGRLNEAAAAIEKVRGAAGDLDAAADACCGEEGIMRLSLRRGDAEACLFPRLTGLRKHLLALTEIIQSVLDNQEEEGKGEDEGGIWELRAVLRRLDTAAGICGSFVEYKERPAEVMWMERHRAAGGPPKREKRKPGKDRNAGSRGPDSWIVFTVTPVEVAPALKEALFKPNRTVICVSATLTLSDREGNHSFRYWAGRSGLSLAAGREVLWGVFPSPFPYARSVLLAAPTDAPLPEEETYGPFVDRAVTALAAAAEGSALILFTSYQALRSAYDAALPELRALGIRCLRQGEDDRTRLLQRFLADERSVLFATDSFREGVDAPGDTLRLVILCRLPFRTPNDPVFEARREAVERAGGSAFMDLSLPEAVMKFKQGFGRLVRRSSDHGVVAVLDGRILKKRYGGFFLGSLPETGRCFDGIDALVKETERFLRR
jgi:ATP-dependent DNA helicase DinG